MSVSFDDGKVGELNWNDCSDCKHYYRSSKGGCDLIDILGESILRIDLRSENVICDKFELKRVET